MGIKQIREVLYGEEYESKGEKKTAWRRCGTMFINENENIGIKLTSIPLTGSLMAFPPKQKEEPKPAEKDEDYPDFLN